MCRCGAGGWQVDNVREAAGGSGGGAGGGGV